MWRQITIIIIIFITLSYLCVLRWLNVPTHVQVNTCTIDDLVNEQTQESIDKAVKKMGPYYHYILAPDGTLRVNKGDGKWLKLKYKINYEKGEDYAK